MKSFLSLQKFQEYDTQVWAINCTQIKEKLLSREIHSGDRSRQSPASVEWGGLRRVRAHRVKEHGNGLCLGRIIGLPYRSYLLRDVRTSSPFKKISRLRPGC
ncbi:hypothetical protein AVEN_31466-1 [Araneus ventricosus]|uniref:Uncharacterized protein n=1 Tax=Araneus ventricosus TaxID=182803 RepID=A0A4Y2HZ53_ARAVE|nr:hypothetical protein AVEN_31466-1 [Araneus ventricosus]